MKLFYNFITFITKMDRFLDWKYFKEDDIISFDSELNEAELKSLIGKSVIIPFEKSVKEFVVDFHFYNFAFCKEQAFDYRKISTYMSIMNEIFLTDMLSSEPSNSMTQSFNNFQNMILNHSVERPPIRYVNVK